MTKKRATTTSCEGLLAPIDPLPVREGSTGEEESMSSGGNVPTQGVSVAEATSEKKRNNRGTLGDGTRSQQMKRMWKKSGSNLSLKGFARKASEAGGAAEDADLAQAWLDAKRGKAA